MNKKVYDTLVKELPNYNQIRGTLIQFGEGGKPKGHCFMGVLYDLAVKAGIVSWGPQGMGADHESWTKVWDWAGIKSPQRNQYGGFALPVPGDEKSKHRTEAFILNDGGTSFAELAKMMEVVGYENL